MWLSGWNPLGKPDETVPETLARESMPQSNEELEEQAPALPLNQPINMTDLGPDVIEEGDLENCNLDHSFNVTRGTRKQSSRCLTTNQRRLATPTPTPKAQAKAKDKAKQAAQEAAQSKNKTVNMTGPGPAPIPIPIPPAGKWLPPGPLPPALNATFNLTMNISDRIPIMEEQDEAEDLNGTVGPMKPLVVAVQPEEADDNEPPPYFDDVQAPMVKCPHHAKCHLLEEFKMGPESRGKMKDAPKQVQPEVSDGESQVIESQLEGTPEPVPPALNCTCNSTDPRCPWVLCPWHGDVYVPPKPKPRPPLNITIPAPAVQPTPPVLPPVPKPKPKQPLQYVETRRDRWEDKMPVPTAPPPWQPPINGEIEPSGDETIAVYKPATKPKCPAPLNTPPPLAMGGGPGNSDTKPARNEKKMLETAPEPKKVVKTMNEMVGGMDTSHKMPEGPHKQTSYMVQEKVGGEKETKMPHSHGDAIVHHGPPLMKNKPDPNKPKHVAGGMREEYYGHSHVGSIQHGTGVDLKTGFPGLGYVMPPHEEPCPGGHILPQSWGKKLATQLMNPPRGEGELFHNLKASSGQMKLLPPALPEGGEAPDATSKQTTAKCVRCKEGEGQPCLDGCLQFVQTDPDPAPMGTGTVVTVQPDLAQPATGAGDMNAHE